MKKNLKKDNSKFKTQLALIVVAIIAITGFTFSFVSFYKFKQPKVGYISLEKVIKEYKYAKKYAQEFEENSKFLRSKVDTLSLEFQGNLKEYEIARSKANGKDLVELEKELKRKQQQLEQYNFSIQEKLKEEEQLSLAKMLNEVEIKVRKYGQENSYVSILAATPTSGIMFYSEAVDLTNEIIDYLNK